MKKDIKDYLHLYLGCEVLDLFNNRINILTGINNDDELPVKTVWEGKGRWALPYSEVKPILRKLYSMTEEERHKFGLPKKVVSVVWFTPENMRQLCAAGFDLFGLIESNLAIEKTNCLMKLKE